MSESHYIIAALMRESAMYLWYTDEKSIEPADLVTPYYYIYRLLLPRQLTLAHLRSFAWQQTPSQSFLALLGCDIQRVIRFAERIPTSQVGRLNGFR